MNPLSPGLLLPHIHTILQTTNLAQNNQPGRSRRRRRRKQKKNQNQNPHGTTKACAISKALIPPTTTKFSKLLARGKNKKTKTKTKTKQNKKKTQLQNKIHTHRSSTPTYSPR
jgi:hypothetical protein